MSRHGFGAACACISLVVALAVLVAPAASAAAGVPSCTLDVSTTQICPVEFKATAGKATTVIVARYEDLSHCNFPAPANEPGDNGNYVVRFVSINWGDGTRTSSGTAETAPGCPGTTVLNSRGVPANIAGKHTYKKPGNYTVLVTIIYVTGAGDTYKNCLASKYHPGDSVYSLTNCIALKAPARSLGVVRLT
jgi:hypothetical protein